MNYIKSFIRYLFFALPILLVSCEEDNLFTTTEAPIPQVSEENWEVSAGGVTTGFAEGGRAFRLPNPLESNYRDINFNVTINSNDERVIDSIFVEIQHLPTISSNAAQGWAGYEGIKLTEAERSSSYNFNYDLNLDDWSEAYWGPGNFWIATGVFGIVREDNTMRLTVVFDDGSSVRLAQVMFCYPLTEAGVE
ncbi:MAG: hypothetical protein CMO01_02810 [Thalassobius sp.]|nr:hypothetical protein [Thalassovita sp.]